MTEFETSGRTTDRSGVGTGVSEIAVDTNVLVAGPTLCGKKAVALDLLAGAFEESARPFTITTTETAEQFRTRFDPFTPPAESAEAAAVIDAHRVPLPRTRHDGRTFRVDSPEDLTGIGMKLWNACESVAPENRDGGRLLIDNFSTLSIYSDRQRLFEFLSTCTFHAGDLGLTTIMLLSTDAVDEQTEERLRSLFSTTIEVSGVGDTTKVRARGEQSTTWTEYVPPTPLQTPF